jgi:MFS family permease
MLEPRLNVVTLGMSIFLCSSGVLNLFFACRVPFDRKDSLAEAKLRRKIDCFVVPTVVVIYLFCFIDRANIGNARLAGFEKDLGLAGYDYNMVLTFFYISYIVLEIPGVMLCKYVGPGWFIPSCSLGFGIMTVCFAFVRTKWQACGVRFLLGVFEAPLLPGSSSYTYIVLVS